MASTSNTRAHQQLEDFASSASASAEPSTPAFVTFTPPITKIPLDVNKRYHVFLSFRGKDVRKTFVDPLYQALSAAGLNVFLDSHNLKKGERIDLTLVEAIEMSAIRVPVFSEGYAGSAWCLKEAAAMLRTSDLIILLFYHIDPTDVRYPVKDSSPYKKSFLKHYGHPDRYREEDVDSWKKALNQICERSGWSTDITGGYQARLVKMVVNDLIQILDRVPLEVARNPVGMDNMKHILIPKLNLDSADTVVKIGIWGIGGIGKTTAAKAVYNQVYSRFDAASFVSDVGTTAQENRGAGLIKLQQIVLRDLCEYAEKVDNVDEGKTLFRDRLGGKRVLLILDDVVTVSQLDALVGNWLAPGSRVVITSRDKHILNVAEVSAECIHEMNGLETSEGLELFSWYAFLSKSPSDNYIDMSKKIVKACKGHPLSLEVIGSFLYDKKDDTGCWMEALHNITLNPDIHNRLYISYNALSDEEKEIFVDIACLFIGENTKFPIIFWKSLQYKMVHTAICNLKMKLLIKVDKEGLFSMHDHLRDLGRSIAEKEKQGTRLWEGAHLNKIDFPSLEYNEHDPESVQMLYRQDLHYLHLKNMTIEDILEVTLPPSLIWISLEHCSFETGKKRARKKKYARKKPSWSWQLKIMQLKHCSGLDNLTLTSLFSLPYIERLQHLELERCSGLDNLPEDICNLSQLQTLSFRMCGGLNNLPDTIGHLSQLQHLHLKSCSKLNNLPDIIGKLSKLQCLPLEGCSSLNEQERRLMEKYPRAEIDEENYYKNWNSYGNYKNWNYWNSYWNS